MIGYYCDNLPLCNLVTNDYCSKMVILFKFLFLKMESIVTLKILGEITHARVYVCACICACACVCACVNVCVHAYACVCMRACVRVYIMCVGGVCVRVVVGV